MRSSGILMPVSSLPSPYGIGTLGQAAKDFVDFAAEAGQKWWQVLPIGPTSYGDSPYQSFSSFAGNPYFIDPDILVQKGLLTHEECHSFDFGGNPSQVDYGKLYEHRFTLLRKACSRFDFGDWDYQGFCYRCGWWLEDYALFMALKAAHNMVSFQQWEDGYRLRHPQALDEFRSQHSSDIDFWKFVQYQFQLQWNELRSYANEKGIGIIGDIPIYVSPDSADVWAGSQLFSLDENLRPIEVAGCPPDAFSATGQLWGNPLYNWEYHKSTGYQWWVQRMRSAGEWYDMVRIDHFRGFESYYAIPAAEETAMNGHWVKGPGMDFIGTLKTQLPELKIIAEDLGFLTPEVFQLLADSGFPGMKVLQFAFDSREESDYLPHNYKPNSVVYTGTHDNTTTADWKQSAPAEDVAFAHEYLGIPEEGNLTQAFIRTALASVCDLAVVPMADYLELGIEGRINEPSTLGKNWVWRAKGDDFAPLLAKRICRMAKIYGRK